MLVRALGPGDVGKTRDVSGKPWKKYCKVLVFSDELKERDAKNMNVKGLSSDFVDVIKSEDIRNDLIEIAKNEPTGVVSTLVNLGKLAKDVTNIPNMLFYSKLEKFLQGTGNIEYEKRIKFISKFVNGQEILFVGKLLYIIDKIDDENKSLILSNLLRSLCYENIDIGMFFRLSNIVNNTTLEDLAYLLKNQSTSGFTLDLNVDSLCKAGLMQKTSMGAVNTYEISFLGNLLLQNGLAYGDLPNILESQDVFFSKIPITINEAEVKSIAVFG